MMQARTRRRIVRQVSLALACLAVTATAAAASNGRVTVIRTPNGGIQPQVKLDKKGVLHLIYYQGDPKAGDIYYVKSTDQGASFSSPLRVNSQPGSAIAVGTMRGAHLAIGRKGRVHVAWNGSSQARPKGPRNPAMPRNSPYNGTPMLYARLNDRGAAFQAQRNLMQFTFALDGGGSLAADEKGKVYVAWHAGAGKSGKEQSRSVWIAKSRNDGKTFAREVRIESEALGACGCCGLRTHVDGNANLYVFYRTARATVNRDMRLLVLRSRSQRFRGLTIDAWSSAKCVGSSASFADGNSRVAMSWETKKQVYFALIDPKKIKFSNPVAAPGWGANRKHPTLAFNGSGELLMAWTEGTAWRRGGSLAWQVFDRKGKPVGQLGSASGLPVWDLPAAFAKRDGSFVVIY